MTSTEIAKRLAEVSEEKSKLELELTRAVEGEVEEKKQKLFSETKAAILELWNIYWKDEDNSEAEERLNNEKEQYRLNIWLEADLSSALKKSELKDIDTIKDIVKDIPNINFEKCVRDAEIRLDFASALKSVRDATTLSGELGYGFYSDDLMNLMMLHKANKFRKKIENLLTDCNYHSESGLLSEKKYDEFEMYVG